MYDGFGRVATSHKPEQRDGSTLKYTTYSYNPDDSILTVTDGRGVDTNYTYNSRGLVTNIGWNVHSTGVTDPSDVSFTYDDVGDRTQMTDGLGQVDYVYNGLSQLTSETRTFSDTLADKPTGNYNLTYTYHLGGQLKSYTDPWGKEIDFANDKVGRVTAITGTSFGGVTSYLSNPAFRAWGAVKHLEYGSADKQKNVTYNSRLQPLTDVVNQVSDTSNKTFDKTYDYYDDGMLKTSDESATGLDKLDRSFTYDFAARIRTAKSGSEAHGTTETDLTKLPYRQTYAFDAFGNVTDRTSTLWNYSTGSWDFSYSITNNLISGASYDFDGRQTIDPNDGETINFQFDGAGQMEKTWKSTNSYETEIYHDGNGVETKRRQRTWDSGTSTWGSWDAVYYVASSVLGRVISETTASGKKRSTYVVSGQDEVALQSVDGSNNESVIWKFEDAAGLSSRGAEVFERDGLGNNVGIHPDFSSGRHENTMTSGQQPAILNLSDGDCEVDGIWTPCSIAKRMQNSGAASQCPNNDCGLHRIANTWVFWRASIGAEGYAPAGEGNPEILAYIRLHTGGDHKAPWSFSLTDRVGGDQTPHFPEGPLTGGSETGGTPSEDCYSDQKASVWAIHTIIADRYDSAGHFVVSGTARTGTIITPVKGLSKDIELQVAYFDARAQDLFSGPGGLVANTSALIASAANMADTISLVYGNENKDHIFSGFINGEKGLQKFYHNPDSLRKSVNELLKRTIDAARNFIACKNGQVA